MAQIARWCLLALVLVGVSSRSQDPAQAVHKQRAQNSDDFLFEVKPRVIAAGETAVLHWSIKGATKVVIEEASESRHELYTVGTFGASGSVQVTPKENTTYVISCEGSTVSCASATVRVRVK